MLPAPNSAIRSLFVFSLLVSSLSLLYRFNQRLENLEQTQVELRNELIKLKPKQPLEIPISETSTTSLAVTSPEGTATSLSTEETLKGNKTGQEKKELTSETPPSPKNPAQSNQIEASQTEERAISPVEIITDDSERDDPFYGSRQATFRITVFTDYQSKLCRSFHRGVFLKLKEDLLDKKSLGVDFKLTLRDFPNESKADSKPAAIWANCWGEQKQYWEAFKHLSQEANWLESGEFSRSGPGLPQVDQNKLKDCLNSSRSIVEVERDLQAALQLGAKGVPTILLGREERGMFKGVKIRGAQSFAVIMNEVKKLIEEKHEAAGAHS